MPELTKAGVGYGIGAGAGRFSTALRDVLLAGQDRDQFAREEEFRRQQASQDAAYRDRTFQADQDYRQESLGLDREQLEATRTSQERADVLASLERGDRLRATGYDVQTPQGGGFSDALMSVLENQQGGVPIPMAGEYDPSNDIDLVREERLIGARGEQDRATIATRAATESSPGAPPTFTKNGMRFPYTPEGIEESQAFESEISGDGAQDERRNALIAGARRRLMNDEGEIETHRLREVLAEMRRRPGTTLEDIQYVQDYFGR